MLPGAVPPTSSWWPRLPTKKRIAWPAGSNTGVMTVMSGRCVPPLNGLLSATTSPGRSVPARDRSTVPHALAHRAQVDGMC